MAEIEMAISQCEAVDYRKRRELLGSATLTLVHKALLDPRLAKMVKKKVQKIEQKNINLQNHKEGIK